MLRNATASLVTLAWITSGACFIEKTIVDPPDVVEEEEDECMFEPWEPEPRGPACSEEEEAALARLWRASSASTSPRQEASYRRPLGEFHGEVVEVDGQTITIDFGGEDLDTFTWFRDIPFSIEKGHVVRKDIGYAETTLTFPHGILWIHSDFGFFGPSEPSSEVGPLEILFEAGCESRWGTSVVPIVVGSDGREHRVLPGTHVEVDHLTFHNHGATYSPGWTECDMIAEGTYRSLWSAEYRDCSFDLPSPSGPTCTQEMEAEISKLWDALDSGLQSIHRYPLGEKIGEVTKVDGRDLSLDFGAGDVRTFTWLTDLPFPIAVGQEVVAETTESASTLEFPAGSLWVHAMSAFSGPDQEVFEVGPLRISHEQGCHTSLGHTIDPIVVAPSGKAVRVLPGKQMEVEGWTFHNHGAFSSPGQTKCDMILEGRYLGFWTAAHASPQEGGGASAE